MEHMSSMKNATLVKKNLNSNQSFYTPQGDHKIQLVTELGKTGSTLKSVYSYGESSNG